MVVCKVGTKFTTIKDTLPVGIGSVSFTSDSIQDDGMCDVVDIMVWTRSTEFRYHYVL